MNFTKTDKNFIENRVKKLRGTSRELKEEFKKNGNSLLEELYLEIDCYADEIEGRLRQIERRALKNGKNRQGKNPISRKKSN